MCVSRAHSITNLAKMLAVLVRDGTISLSILKAMDFVQLPPSHTFFLRAFLTSLLVDSTEDQVILAIQRIAPVDRKSTRLNSSH